MTNYLRQYNYKTQEKKDYVKHYLLRNNYQQLTETMPSTTATQHQRQNKENQENKRTATNQQQNTDQQEIKKKITQGNHQVGDLN